MVKLSRQRLCGIIRDMRKDILTLRSFLSEVRQVIELTYPLQYSVLAEIAQINTRHQSGHCYLMFVEKDGEVVVAKASGVIWKSNLFRILNKFKDAVGGELREGMKVLFTAEVRFHELYGLSLNVVDVDPSYTLGEFALTRKKILAQIEKEGLLLKNKQQPFPMVPQRIAVISSGSSAGYEDFLNTLDSNPYGFRFAVTLFSAYMQGEQAETSILNALRECALKDKMYDVLVIIRGGGDNIDLHCFDSYNLGKAIANFPLPVLSGIGHTRDETVVDIVSYKKMITPTSAGRFIIEKVKDFEDYIENLSGQLTDKALDIIDGNRVSVKEKERHLNFSTEFFLHKKSQSFKTEAALFKTNAAQCIASRSFVLKQISENIFSALRIYTKGHMGFLERQEDRVSLINPVNVLKRGYSITLKDGKVLKDKQDVKEGDVVETQLYKGRIRSRVEN